MSFNNISGVEHARNQEYVHRVNFEKGWYAKPVTFLDAMALLTTEIAEVRDAYEDEGLLGGWQAQSHMCSEFADIYIRLVDDASRFGVNLGLAVDIYKHSYEPHKATSFDGVCMQLLRRVRDLCESYRIYGLNEAGHVCNDDTHRKFAHMFLQLQDTCDEYGVDLMKAFDAKMAVNTQRAWRHGNKHA